MTTPALELRAIADCQRDIHVSQRDGRDRAIDPPTFVVALRAIGATSHVDMTTLQTLNTIPLWQDSLIQLMSAGAVRISIPDCVSATQLFRTLLAFEFDATQCTYFLLQQQRPTTNDVFGKHEHPLPNSYGNQHDTSIGIAGNRRTPEN